VLDEVVVTALGIKRDRKALGYGVSEVKGEELTKAKETNVINSLSGKVAGLVVQNTAGGASGSTRVLLRGMEDMEKHLSRQKSIAYNAAATLLNEIAYRPMLIMPPQMSVENLKVNIYSGYEKNPNQNVFKIQCAVIDSDNNAVEYALKDNSTGKILSDFSTDSVRDVTVVSLDKLGAETTVDVIIKADGEDKTVATFKIFREELYRLSVSRIYGAIYDGWKSDGVDTHATVLTPTTSNTKNVNVVGSNSYINISPVTNKVTFS
jgi:hypothetical protein